MTTTTEHERRKAERICTVRGCKLAAADDANECPSHRDRRRERVRRAMQKKRKKWADAGRCKNCGRVRRKGSKWGCRVCDPGREPTVNTKRDRIAANTTERTTTSNLGRTHYHGRGRLGRASVGELDARDFSDAVKSAAKAKAIFDYAHSPEVKALPTIQRGEEMARSVDELRQMWSFWGEALERHGVDLTSRNQG